MFEVGVVYLDYLWLEYLAQACGLRIWSEPNLCRRIQLTLLHTRLEKSVCLCYRKQCKVSTNIPAAPNTA